MFLHTQTHLKRKGAFRVEICTLCGEYIKWTLIWFRYFAVSIYVKLHYVYLYIYLQKFALCVLIVLWFSALFEVYLRS